MEERNLIERLTEREKECLRLWLEHKTAKEIALDLGISHFAVEKRLKMARTKLDVPSSLEAARLLADHEGYQQMVAQPADLPIPDDAPDRWFSRPLMLGVVIMSILTAGLLALALQTSPLATPGYETEIRAESVEYESLRDEVTAHNAEFTMRRVSEERVQEYLMRTFNQMDRNASGFVERGEAPGSFVLQPAGPGHVNYDPDAKPQTLTGEEAWQRYLADNDKDGDDKVSYEEFHSTMYPAISRYGIPLIPVDTIPLPQQERDD